MAKLVRWTPRTSEQMFNNLWQQGWGSRPDAYHTETARPVLRPAMDVIENETGITVHLNLPGLSPDDVNVEVDGDLLTVSGELGDTVEQEGDRYHYRERCTGAFKRSLRLADTLDTENIEATFDNGVLTLSLPKLPEAQPKRIKVANA